MTRATWEVGREEHETVSKTSDVIVGKMGSLDALGYRRDIILMRPPVGAMWTAE